jgi:hypothetical protein
MEPDRLLDDLWRKAVAAIADFLHSRGYRTASGTASQKRRDKASKIQALKKTATGRRQGCRIRRRQRSNHSMTYTQKAQAMPA